MARSVLKADRVRTDPMRRSTACVVMTVVVYRNRARRGRATLGNLVPSVGA